MRFRRQMHHRVGGMGGKNPVQRRAVADVGLFERIARAVRNRGHIVQTGGIGQRIKVDHRMARPHRLPHHGRPDEPGPARHKDFHGLRLRR